MTRINGQSTSFMRVIASLRRIGQAALEAFKAPNNFLNKRTDRVPKKGVRSQHGYRTTTGDVSGRTSGYPRSHKRQSEKIQEGGFHSGQRVGRDLGVGRNP